MDLIRGIPDMWLSAAFVILSFLLFSAGGTAFGQSTFYGGLFTILALVLFFAGVYLGRRGRGGG